MNILYLGYWPAADPLTTAVIVPRLKTLSAIHEVNRVVFCSFERGQPSIGVDQLPNVQYVQFRSDPKRNIFLTKFADFIEWPSFIKKLVGEYKINLIIANSPLAGGAAYLVWRTTRVPFMVECFEPHAEYMVESEIWRRWDPRYWILKYFEKMQKKHAWMLQTVSNQYSRRLLEEGVSQSRIFMLPNTVQTEIFRFNQTERIRKRMDLGFPKNVIVGIYVGKFGGIYYEQEAFDLFAAAFHFFGIHFRMIILSPQDSGYIESNLISRNLDIQHIFVGNVPHSEVPNYLSAADFAFATIKPSPSRIYCCPVKNGEYWANGLPILLEAGIGDDSDIIKNEGGGIIFDNRNPIQGFKEIADILMRGRFQGTDKIFLIAMKYRRAELMHMAYLKIINDYNQRAFT
jgi:glycosyltransferase involved in cell wall biosynthesis